MLTVEEKGSTHTSPKRRVLIIVGVVLAFLVVAAIGVVVGYFIGRSDGGKKSQTPMNLENIHKEAVEMVSTDELRSNLKYFTEVPHFPGSQENVDLAKYIQSKWKEYGFTSSTLKKYIVMLSRPTKPGFVAMYDGSNQEIYRSAAQETFLVPSENNSNVVTPFNAYAPSGSVRGKLVYANYGRDEDFDALIRIGVNVSGKIVIMRYGKVGRATKSKRAHKLGAIGAIYYMDPQEYAKEGVDKVYPKYNWMPSTGVQRGNIKSTPIRGDPQTPGYPSVEGMYRLPKEEAEKLLPQIPVHPIGYKDAYPLLKTLVGELPPNASFQGRLNFSYGVKMADDDSREILLNVSNENYLADVYNVVGVMKGSTHPDELVMLGNHRDAWIFGAADPSSGTAAMMELSRVLGEQIKKGWRPKRTIVFLSWGAEEPQYMGSVEWLEEYSRLLSARGVAYLNVDMSVDGNYSFRAKSAPLLDWVLARGTMAVQSPLGNESAFDEWIRKIPNRLGLNYLPRLQLPRAGSDYVNFIQRLGIPIVDIRYTYNSKTSSNPLYHTVHDNFWWMSNLIDPQFKYHQVTTRVLTQITMTLADAVILPFNVTHYSVNLKEYTVRIKNKFEKDFTENNASKELEFLDKAVQKFQETAEKFDEYVLKADKEDDTIVRKINNRLLNVERSFINLEPILQENPLQRHVVLTHSPSIRYDWYGGVVDAIFRARKGLLTSEDVKKQISIVSYGINSATHVLELEPIE
ncbi:glutamate carboxypeptidase 2-like [Montipora capricornis]|uniref:glutamate carboxypeptidase 2-like n=1 Tax=Montipora capricornis TaxID=246305 RepID=UPI0035F161BB